MDKTILRNEKMFSEFIKACLSQGLRVSDIAEKIGVHRKTIYEYAKKYSISLQDVRDINDVTSQVTGHQPVRPVHQQNRVPDHGPVQPLSTDLIEQELSSLLTQNLEVPDRIKVLQLSLSLLDKKKSIVPDQTTQLNIDTEWQQSLMEVRERVLSANSTQHNQTDS